MINNQNTRYFKNLKFSIKNKILILFLTIIVTSVGIVGLFGFQNAKDSYMESSLSVSAKETNDVSNKIESILKNIPKDVLYNSNFYALEKLLIWENLDEKRKINNWKKIYISALKDYIYNKKHYYQIRVLDINGNEKISIKYDKKTDKVFQVAEKELSNKSSRDYFTEALKLRKGEIYISPMNLNIEHGKIEKPYVPVVRYSTPLVNQNGELKGILVLNFNAEYILNEIANTKDLDSKRSKQKYYLLNKEGYYLYNQNKDKMWGFQLEMDFTFQNDHKGVFESFKNKEKSTFIYEDNIFSMHKVYPSKIDNRESYWYFVTTLDKDIALSSVKDFINRFLIVFLGVLIFGLFLINKYISQLIDPLITVSKQLDALSRGEIKKEEIEYSGQDEVGKIIHSTTILIEAIETTISQANAVASGDFSKEIELLSINDKLGLALRDMTKRLKEIVSLSKKLSVGDYDVKIIVKTGDDELGLAMLEMVKYLTSITKIVEAVAIGDIGIKYDVKSKNDRLGFATLEMIQYLKAVVNQANSITNNDFSQNIDLKSKKDELGIALLTMTDMLKTNANNSKNEIWFSEGIREFSDIISGLSNPIDLANIALSQCSRYVNAASSIMYDFDKESNYLNLVSSFSFIVDENTITRFALDEGVIGQVGFEKKAIFLNDLDDDNFNNNIGITNFRAKEIFIFPLLHNDKLLGVIKMQSVNGFSQIQKEYLLKVAQVLGTSLFTVIQNLRIKTLFEESQNAFSELQLKSEEMQTQSEELRASNEQMEQQAVQLKTQSENLHIKNNEIEKAKLEIDKRANELETSNQYKSEFLANMSHELRTPLNSVILLSSLLTKNNEENLTTSDIEKLNVINESGNELLRLINDILDLSKIESGKMELIVDEINPSELLKHYSDTFLHSAKEKNIVLKIEDNYKDIFYNDKNRLSQIVRNLISNALKFTHSGTIEMSISKSNNTKLPIKIAVKDTGIGIAKEKQELIFKAFMQADGSTSRKFGGTGLGLSISRELSFLMGGKIELVSEEGEGSTFIIYLPSLKSKFLGKKEQNDDESAFELVVKNDKSKKKTHSKKEQFLIIEDDITFANILKNTVIDQGFKAFVANTGKAGIKIALNHHIKGAIVDLGLPDINGLEVIKTLKSNPLTQDIHIQVISGEDICENELGNIRVDGYLQKPVSSEQIHKTIQNLEKNKDITTKSLLIVEDNITHLNALKDYIEEEKDFEIVTAQNIEEAKKIIDNKYFDIAIIDLGLSDGNGTEICEELTFNRQDTIVLIYTGRDLTMEEADFLNEISDEIIIKNPNSHVRLRDEIKKFLEKPHQTVNKRFSSHIQNIDVEITNDNKSLLKNKKVLVVDDDIKNIFVLSSALQEYDMDISHAKNGKEALEFLSKNKDIDIVLMDIMMPVMNGYECMKAIRLDDSMKHLPIIAVTAKAMDKDKQEALRSGADDYLTKPIDLEKLQAMIVMWINK